MSVGGEEAAPSPPAGPAGAGALGGAAGAESSAAAAAGPEPRAARPAAGGVRPPSPAPRLGAPTRPRSGAGTGRGQREGPARGGEGAGPPRAGSGRRSPGGGGSGGGGGGSGRAARCPPQSARPRRTRARPRRGALSTAHGEYRPRRPARAARRAPPRFAGPGLTRTGRLAPRSRTRRARASAAVGALGGRTGPRTPQGTRGARAARAAGTAGGSGPGKAGLRASVSFCARGAATQVCTPARGTSAWRAGGVDAAGCVWPLSGPGSSATHGGPPTPARTAEAPGAQRTPAGAVCGAPGMGRERPPRRLLAAFVFESPAAPGLRGPALGALYRSGRPGACRSRS